MRACMTIAVLVGLSACSDKSDSSGAVERGTQHPKGVVTVSVVGTNDLHGALDRLPILAGFVENLRASRKADDGGVVLIDGGDMFQGTIESNANEGAAVIDAYNAMGYDAAAIGNHEFDFGPVGPKATPQVEGDDPRGALLARMQQAEFALLAANVVVAESGELFGPPTTFVEASGAKVAIIGVTTEATPYTTMPANFVGLAMRPLAAAIERAAKKARAAGHEVVIVAAHAGSKCKDLSDPHDTGSCVSDAEIFEVARALPAGLVDVIVAGHTHSTVAHYVNGIAIIESYAKGRAFGRVDLRVDLDEGRVVSSEIHQPRELCPGKRRVPAAECEPGTYEGKPVTPSARIAKLISDPIASADLIRKESLGVEVSAAVKRSRGYESALGNLFVDLMLAARPGADVAITNGGGLRADFPVGPLTYGSLYEAMPFDNRFSLVRLFGRHLRAIVVDNLTARGGIFSFGGVRIAARCEGGAIEVTLTRPNGKAIGDEEELVVVTSDFLSSGGDGTFGKLGLPEGAIAASGDDTIRDALASALRERGGTLSGKDAMLFSEGARRFRYPGKRPVSCKK
jgi:5'-nucleotidase